MATDAVFDQLDDAVARFLTLARCVDANNEDLAVEGRRFTAGGVVHHIAYNFRLMLGDDDETERGTVNDAITEIQASAPRIRENFEPLVEPLGVAVGFGAPAFLLGEISAHGDDLARTIGQPWEPKPADVIFLFRYSGAAMTSLLEDKDANTSWELRFAGDDRPVLLSVAGGVVTIDPQPAPTPDHVLDISDPVGFALAFPYRRRPLADARVAPLAALFREPG